MEAVPKVKCHFHNRGFCKYKDKGCEYLHPVDSCVNQDCRDTECPKRHQHSCKFKDKCKFQKKNKCEYIHKANASKEHNTNNTRSESDKQIDTLETKVKDLKDTLQNKENLLNETNGENKKLSERIKLLELELSEKRNNYKKLEKVLEEKR